MPTSLELIQRWTDLRRSTLRRHGQSHRLSFRSDLGLL